MGLFSRIFGGRKSSGIVSGRNPGRGFVEANKFNRARGGFAGGYAAWTFKNIMDAHCTEDDIISEFGLDQEDCDYKHPFLGTTCWQAAYREALQEAMETAMMLGGDPEDFIDWDQVEEDAYDYATELAGLYINGDIWIPLEILEWAYYDVSSHNG